MLLASWPAWVLAAAILIAAGVILWHITRNRGRLGGWRPVAVWCLQTALVALVLFLLWRPALSIATLRPQQNIVAVLLDDSGSMAIREGGKTRLEQATAVLRSGLAKSLGERFQVRLYRFGKHLERIQNPEEATGKAEASRIGESLKEALAEASTLPLGAVVLLSDGADNAGGIDLETVSQIRQKRIPVHTIGMGRERFEKDIEVRDVQLAPRVLADSRLSAQVTYLQNGFTQGKARLSVKEGGKVLASKEITFKADGTPETETLVFNAGTAATRSLQFSIDPMEGEENRDNNARMRLVNVEASKPRILYIEGEPRWEFKFIRRAIEEDRSLELVSMLRTTQNKIYFQGTKDTKELKDGFPAKAEELFAYQGLIIGNVEAGYFTPAQQELIREFVNRRGGGVLFLGGRATLSEGGYASSPFMELLPVSLPDRKGTFHRDEANPELTATGRDNLICRLEEQPDRNAERWKKLPLLADYQEVGAPKPGAVVLAEARPAAGGKYPLLAIQNYGRGRSAIFATSGSWRWQMQQPLEDRTHEMFWQQLLRWLVSESPGQIAGATPRSVLSDETNVQLRAEVRSKSFQPLANAKVQANIMGPEGLSATVPLDPVPDEEGIFAATWTADKPGSYVAEILATEDEGGKEKETGRDVVVFRREDGVAEHFNAGQNRELLQKLSEQTGGRYYTPETASKLSEEISYSEAGITVRETRDLWDMPAIFLLALVLRSLEWLLRRKWGVV
ncbi:MAG: glutamine amidotransferase [Bryobacteraceae bacterium]